MSIPVLILGESGTGKSRSIKNLDPATTVIINVLGKSLPFKGWRKNYSPLSSKEKTGNIITTDDWQIIQKSFAHIAKDRPEIKTIIIDDFQYIMANEFMRRSSEKGYDKFNDIGTHAWNLLFDSKFAGENTIVYFLSHSELDDYGKSRCKTIGKMLNDKICIEGMFTIVLNTALIDGKYYFETQGNGSNTSKSPEEMFDTLRIENDLQAVSDAVTAYESE